MSPKAHDPAIAEEKSLMHRLNSGIGLLSWRLLVLIIGAMIAAIAWQGKNMGYAFIAQSPATVANTVAIEEAKAAVVVAKQAADKASDKADQSFALSSKIFDAIKELKDDTQATKVSVASSSAVISTQVSDLGSRLARIEAKQDAGR